MHYHAGAWERVYQGISRGFPLNPIFGALYLKALDDHFIDKNLYYVRYMDDILILTKTRWQNRKAVKQLNQILNKLKVEKRPDKTFIGKISRGFDFIGYHFDGQQLTVAVKTVEKHVTHYRQLYEQLRKKKATSGEMASILGLYAKRWQRWAIAGLPGIKVGARRYRENLLLPQKSSELTDRCPGIPVSRYLVPTLPRGNAYDST
jgi:RNA-directed DNA polymerase